MTLRSGPLRLLAPPFLAGAGLLLVWYGVFAYQVGTTQVEFLFRHPSSNWFPVVNLWRGNAAYFVDLDGDRALAHYRRAIAAEAVLVDAWLALARAELAQGRADRAEAVLDFLSPILARTSTWKWSELLLAHDLDRETEVRQAFNFILDRVPTRRQDAVYLALQRWGDYDRISAQVDAPQRGIWLRELLRRHETDAAMAVWRQIQDPEAVGFDRRAQLQLCNFLIDRGRIEDAREVWRSMTGSGPGGIHNGGFESDLGGGGFGWRLQANLHGLTVKRTSTSSAEGAFSLQLRFNGKANLAYRPLSQLVPVAPGNRYRLQFARKSRNLTSNEGVFLELAGWRCPGLNLQSPAVTGTETWRTESLEFTVPDACEALWVRVGRRESLRFAGKISGEYWLDAVALSRLEPGTGDGGEGTP